MGTQPCPLTTVTGKQPLPAYDKFTIYYPMLVPMIAGISDILVTSAPAPGSVSPRPGHPAQSLAKLETAVFKALAG